MQIFKTTLFTLLASLLAAACSDDYLEITPQSLTNDQEFLSSPDKAQQALNGAYDALTYDGFLGGNVQFLSDLMADNIDGAHMNNSDWLAHYTWTTDIFLGTTWTCMQDGYRPIARANYLLDNLANVPGLDAGDATRMAAEAKFIRAVCHFELLRLFAQPWGFTADNSHPGIAMRTKFGRELLARASVKEVYDQVIADLNAAAADLPSTNGAYASRWAAKGYLAKVYFQQNNFSAAYDAAHEVIQNGGFALDTSAVNRFRQAANPENVFALLGTNFDSDNAGNRFKNNYRQDPSTKTAAAYISPNLYSAASVNPNDRRLKEWYLPAAFGPLTVYAFKKWPTTAAEGPAQVPLVGLAELKLIRAESAAELNKELDQAAQDVRDIQSRAGVPSTVSAEKSVIIAAAREERRLELAGEGNRLHELKRQAGAGNPSLKIRGIAPWNCAGLVCQIPAGELQANPELVPNPIGGCQ